MSILVNGFQVGKDKYPNGETIFKTSFEDGQIPSTIFIELKYETDEDLTILMITKRYLDEKFPVSLKYLEMKYVPYSRMDREIEGYMFSLKYFADIINSMNFDGVFIFDVHSAKTNELLNGCVEKNPQPQIDRIFSEREIDYVLYPDKGAMARYSKILKLPDNTPFFNANKKRDLTNGKIIGFELIDCPNIQNKNILIIDDLCAKGGTFMASAQLLKDADAANIYLYVSHCEDSIFNGDILKTDLIDKIYTTDSILTKSHEKIEVMKGWY